MEQHLTLSQQIENLLVVRNPRGMKTIQPVLEPGYYMRAAMLMAPCKGTVIIATGFPVNGTFETDGPVGAIALYQVLSMLGATPILVCGRPLVNAIQGDYRTHCMSLGEKGQVEAQQILNTYQPELMISIELPGRARDGKYYNMRGVDISDQVIFFDEMVKLAHCPTIGIGDGGNETGMGKIYDALSCLDIIPCATSCDELVIADVSNWAAHGLIAMLSILTGKNMWGEWNNRQCLEYLLERGSVDGVTGEKTLTEDGYSCKVTESVIAQLKHIIESSFK